jgi:hypothetical protein
VYAQFLCDDVYIPFEKFTFLCDNLVFLALEKQILNVICDRQVSVMIM